MERCLLSSLTERNLKLVSFPPAALHARPRTEESKDPFGRF